MYIKHKDTEFKILINKAESIIHVKGKKNNIYTISVPHNLPNSELIAYLNIYGQTLIDDFENSDNKDQYTIIDLYNKKFTVTVSKDLTMCCRKGNTIYSPYSTKSAQKIKKLCEEVFRYDIRGLIAVWEDRLNCSINDINIKRFKTKSFEVCHLSNTINISSKLLDYEFNYVQFIIAKSIFVLLKMDSVLQNELMEKYVNDYKHSIRIFEYEGG